MSTPRLAVLVTAATLAGGCVTTRAQHEALTARVAQLEAQQVEVQAEREQLAQTRRELRDDVAGLTLRMDEVEETTRDVRGTSEEAGYLATAASQEVMEMRSDVDGRLQVLEERLQEATGIPETKNELWAEAERQLAEKNHKYARRLWRMFEVRYPEDPRMSEVAFSIGLTHFGERDYKAAIIAFHRVAEKWGRDSAFLVDSLYYAGLSFEKLGQCDNATKYFETIIDEQIEASDKYETEARAKIEALKKDQDGICLDRERTEPKASPEGDTNADADADADA